MSQNALWNKINFQGPIRLLLRSLRFPLTTQQVISLFANKQTMSCSCYQYDDFHPGYCITQTSWSPTSSPCANIYTYFLVHNEYFCYSDVLRGCAVFQALKPPRPVREIALLCCMWMTVIPDRKHTYRPPLPVTAIALLCICRWCSYLTGNTLMDFHGLLQESFKINT
jgi:hypothetical protein